jgi:hypothetical protein
MKRATSLFLFLLLINQLWACELKAPIVSLSSPITSLLREMDLLSVGKVKGISMFHHAPNFRGKKLGGGIFLAKKTIDQFQAVTVFFDEGRELSERLKSLNLKEEIKTRGLDPFTVTTKALEILTPYLEDCTIEIKKISQWVEDEKKWQISKAAFKKKYFFFLGAILGDKLPELMIVRDGFVMFWIEKKKLQTFESELSYVRWGEKWKKSLEDEILVGVSEDSKRDFLVKKNNIYNLNSPGALAPGVDQIKFMRKVREVLD